MTQAEWRHIKYFTPEENWGKPEKMDDLLLKNLDLLRDFVGFPFKVHCGYATTGHSKNSYHYKGLAVDGHFEKLSLVEQFLFAIQFSFNGIGIYPYWENPGLHLDLRPGPQRKLWMQTREGYYKNLTIDDIEKLIQIQKEGLKNV